MGRMGRMGLAPGMGSPHCRREQYIHPPKQLQLEASNERDTDVTLSIASLEQSISWKHPISRKHREPELQTRSWNACVHRCPDLSSRHSRSGSEVLVRDVSSILDVSTILIVPSSRWIG